MMPFEDRPDEELIERVKLGCRNSFQALYDRYKLKLFNYFFHLLGNRESAEDCTQDLFIHLYKKAALYAPRKKFSSWLYAMAKNMAYDVLRKNKVRRAASLDSAVGPDDVSLSEKLSSPGLAPDKIAESDDLVQMLRGGISLLNEKDREVIVLCDIQELPHQEVAEILGCPAETVAVRLFRARKRLAEILGLKDELREK